MVTTESVLDASVASLTFVKEKSRRNDLDGAGLMTTVFSKNPRSRIQRPADKTEEDEQEDEHLFLGAVSPCGTPELTPFSRFPGMALDTLRSQPAREAVDQAKRV